MTTAIPAGYAEATRASWRMDDEISRAVIRLWCEVLEDANPMYYDDEFAAATPVGGIMAPPAMIMIWCTRAEWTPTGPVPTIAEYFRDGVPGYPHSIGLSSRHRHSRPLRLGERLTVHQFVNPPAEEETTIRGRGRRVVRYNSLRDDAGNEIASLEIESLRIRRPEDAAFSDSSLPAMPAWSQELEIAMAPEARSVGEAEAGAVLPSLVSTITYKRFIKWVAATRDFFEAHHDRAYATKLGAPDMYIGVHFFHGLVGRYVTDWTGPAGLLRAMDFRSYGRCFPDETVSVVGRIVPVPADRGLAARPEPEGRVLIGIDIVIGCERGRLYDAAVTVSVPGGAGRGRIARTGAGMTRPGLTDGARQPSALPAEGAPLRVGILGVDWGGRVHVPAFRAVTGYEVVALCSARHASAQLARERTGIEDVSTDWQSFVRRDDLDVVSIATSVGSHHDILLAALDAGRNVACEKPLAPSLDDATRMLAAAESSPGRSLVCFEMRWLPERLAIRQLVAAGAVGAPSFIQVTLTNNRWHRTRPPQRTWMYSRAAGGGYLAGSMSHEIDFVLSLFGPPAEVCADVRHSIDQVELPEGGVMPVTADDTSAVLVRMASGALAVFTNSAAGFGASTRLFEVHGADGTIAVHKDDNGTSTTVARVGEEPARLVPSARRLASGAAVPQRNSTWAIEAMGLMLEDWRPAFYGGTTCVPTFRDAWLVQRVIEGALESSAGAGWVDVR